MSEQPSQHYLNPSPKTCETAITIQPQVGFSFKTHIESCQKVDRQLSYYPPGSTVYINICHADNMPAPALASEAEIQEALAAAPGATYQIPLSLGIPRQEGGDENRKKEVIMDACIHTQPFIRSERDLDFRLYVLELAMEHTEDALTVTLSREFMMLKVTAKGLPIPKRIIHVPKAPGSVDNYISTKMEESKTSALITPINKAQQVTLPTWSCSPSFHQENGILTVVLQMPSSGVPSTWKIEVGNCRLLLKGVEKNKAIDIMLPVVIDVSSSSNKVDYYKRSRHLVVNLVISDVRQRYL